MKAGLAVAPVVAALRSRDVLAGTYVCQTPSAWVSATNLSHSPQANGCNGYTPGYWQNYTHHHWPSPYYPVSNEHHSATLLADVFSGAGCIAGSSVTLLGALNPGHSGLGAVANLAFQLVGALLNIAAGVVTVIDEQTLIDMGNQALCMQPYTLSTGAQLSWQQVQKYLANVINTN